jgi:hypothetical protein
MLKQHYLLDTLCVACWHPATNTSWFHPAYIFRSIHLPPSDRYIFRSSTYLASFSHQMLPCSTQEYEVKRILIQLLITFHQTLWFPSMHAALLKPHRLSAWLEAATKLAMPECKKLLVSVARLVTPDIGEFPGELPSKAPGQVTAQQWKEGAVQLQREVSHCL